MWYSGPSFSPSHPKTRDVWILATPLHINLNNHHPPQHTHIFPPLLSKPVQTDKMGYFSYVTECGLGHRTHQPSIQTIRLWWYNLDLSSWAHQPTMIFLFFVWSDCLISMLTNHLWSACWQKWRIWEGGERAQNGSPLDEEMLALWWWGWLWWWWDGVTIVRRE